MQVFAVFWREKKARNRPRITLPQRQHMQAHATQDNQFPPVPAGHGAHSSMDSTAFEVPAGQALQDTAPAPSCCCPAGHGSQMWVVVPSTKAWHSVKLANAWCKRDAKVLGCRIFQRRRTRTSIQWQWTLHALKILRTENSAHKHNMSVLCQYYYYKYYKSVQPRGDRVYISSI